MTEVINNGFLDIDKFPRCFKEGCFEHLEIQNRFKCHKCLRIFCSQHRIDFNHECPFIKTNNFVSNKKNYKQLCSLSSCNCILTEINKFTCKKCNKNYCISHRIDFVHKCN